MITTQVGVDGIIYTCHHNGDYSGDVVINAPVSHLQFAQVNVPENGRVQVTIPFELMAELVGNMINEKLRGHLEQMSGKDFIMKVMDS